MVERFSIGRVVLFGFCVLVLAAVPASAGTSPARTQDFTECASTSTTVCLRIWLSGFGRVDATPEGGGTSSCDYTTTLDNQRECPISVPRGRPVRLDATAEPVPGSPVPSQFVHWSRFECPGTAACTINAVDDDEWVVAVFTPVKLELDESGDGTVQAPGLTCPADCVPAYGLFTAESQVTVTATPAADNVLLWHPGCEPAGGNFSNSTCTVTLTNIRNFATAAFGPPGTELFPPEFPFQISVGLKVRRSGTGQGTVTGGAIDCGAKCSDTVGFQTTITLEAHPSAGSRFVRWAGVCATGTTCRFSAGSVTTIGARFDLIKRQALVASLLKVSVKGRVIAIRVRVDRKSKLTARLLKHGKTVAKKGFSLTTGRNIRSFRVPRRVKPGAYRLSLKIVAGSDSRTSPNGSRSGGRAELATAGKQQNAPAEPREGRGMGYAKQAGVVVGLISGVVGLVFLFFPQLRPERHSSIPEQSARVFGVSLPNRHTTRGDFLDYSERDKLGLTKEQLAQVGASAFANIEIVGYKGKRLTIVRHVVDARTGHTVGKAFDFTVTPPKDTVIHPWGDFAPLRPGRGSYVMVIKLLDGPVGQPGVQPIACRQTQQFGGLAGFEPVKDPPQVCPAAE